MPGYFSEIRYAGGKPTDFIEMVVPVGTDVSGYTIVIYNSTGAVSATFSLGGIVSTSAGGDVYLLDTNTPGFSGIGQNEGFALVDDLGNVLQFISVNGTQITAVEGPADGLTSTSIGANAVGESLETDDDGASYYVQPTPNPGIIQCYAPGTMIDTPDGARAVETLRPCDLVMTLDHGPQPIKWIRAGDQPLEALPLDARPVLISAGALGPDRPARDLIVSPQHRILVGGLGQLDGLGEGQAFAPAKALTGLPGIRFMRGKRSITWVHFACARHEVVIADGCVSESLLLGRMVLNQLTGPQRRSLHRLFGPQASSGDALNGRAARPCLTVGAVRMRLAKARESARAAA